MLYQFRGPGAPPIPAEVVGTELQRIYDERGELKPEAVVEQARPTVSSLHSAFEWDDTAAAEEHRKNQARQLIRVVALVPDPRKAEAMPPVRAFVSVSKPDAPRVLDAPYQMLLSADYIQAANDHRRADLMTEAAGQGVRFVERLKPSRQIVLDMVAIPPDEAATSVNRSKAARNTPASLTLAAATAR